MLNWLCLTGDEENDVSFYNLDQILMVTEVRQGHCLIIFTNDRALDLTGAAADGIVAYLESEAKLSSGMSMADVLEKRKREGPPRVIPFEGSEPQK